MNKVADDFDKITPETQSVLIQTKKTLNNANQSISDIGAAARSIKNLTDYLERHPEAILKGKGK
jgi:paraquat-inducible protein B